MTSKLVILKPFFSDPGTLNLIKNPVNQLIKNSGLILLPLDVSNVQPLGLRQETIIHPTKSSCVF